MIELNNVTVSRSGRKLLEDFSLKIAPDEHWVITGPPGAGKTTLLALIAGSIRPASGQVKYNFITDADWQEHYNQLHKSIRYVPANAIQIFMSGYHELFYQQRYYSMGEDNIPKVRNFLGDGAHQLATWNFPDTFNIEDLMDIELTRLSNGQLKKVVILSNLLTGIPKFILFDFPFEGLDRQSRKDLIGFIDHIATNFAIQIILTDHHHELPEVINRKLMLQDFRIASIEKFTQHSVPINTTPAFSSVITTLEKNSPVVEMKDVTIQYGTRKIIQNLSWTINKGERWALTGKNGSGKTTLFSLIYADHPMAYSQKIFLFGKRRGSGESIWDIKKRITYLGPEQVHFLNPGNILISAREYILNQKSNQKEHLKMLIEFLQAESFIDYPVRWLSSAQLQMMLLMQSFMETRELVLLDEPFQFLDSVSKQRVVEYLSHHLESDTTLVLITHYEDDLLQWTKKRMNL